MGLVCRVEGRSVVSSVGRRLVVVVERGRLSRRGCGQLSVVVLSNGSLLFHVDWSGLECSSVVVECRCGGSSVVVMMTMVVLFVVVTAVVAVLRSMCSIGSVSVQRDRDCGRTVHCKRHSGVSWC
jgi:hypothetical protein